MKITGNIGKYQLSQTIGEGTFAKVKRARNVINDQQVAIKIIDKNMVLQNKLMYQVQREIRTMKLLNHPNIVRIHEVLASKTKIYIVMEYVAGGQLSDKLSYAEKLSEDEARKLFQQLIDAVEYCHCRGVYHRDLKPQNLLLDNQGNLKVSDFGLSAFWKPESLLSTRCGSPSYVAPELIRSREYDGAAADIWACGVILFEMLSGYLPFSDQNVARLYKKILEADYKCPRWFTADQKLLLSRIFQIDPRKRMTIPEIIEDEWFQTDFDHEAAAELMDRTSSNFYQVAPNAAEESTVDNIDSQKPRYINAFKLIALSQELDLSGLFEEKENKNAKHKMILGSKHSLGETIEMIQAAARDSCLSVERKGLFRIKMLPQKRSTSCRPCANLSAEVFEVSPTCCVVKLSKSTGELRMYQEFCSTLTNLLEETCQPLTRQMSKDDSLVPISIHTEHERKLLPLNLVPPPVVTEEADQI
ncbi:hypothetical protein V2J09_000333 [Rumex salicifolius]